MTFNSECYSAMLRNITVWQLAHDNILYKKKIYIYIRNNTNVFVGNIKRSDIIENEMNKPSSSFARQFANDKRLIFYLANKNSGINIFNPIYFKAQWNLLIHFIFISYALVDESIAVMGHLQCRTESYNEMTTP